MTDDTNTQTNSGNGSAPMAANAPLSKEASIRAQVHCLIKLAVQAREEAARAHQSALEVLVALSRGLADYLDQPTQEQRDAFDAWFKAESNHGADGERQAKMLELWHELHPGHVSASTEGEADDGIPF